MHPTEPPVRFRRRAAAIYLMTLSISVLIAATGITLIASQQSDRRLHSNIRTENQAWWCARAGLEMALTSMEQLPLWRDEVTSYVFCADVPVGNGTCTVTVSNEQGDVISNDYSEPVYIMSTGVSDGASVTLGARLLPRPHEALSFCGFGTSSDLFELKGNAVVKGPVRSHGSIAAAAGVTKTSDASFETMMGYTIAPSLQPAKYVNTAISPPQPDLAVYLSLATPITGSYGGRCELKGYNLTPTCNPTGPPNPKGIYSLDAGGREVVIEDMHLRGTLIIFNTAGNSVRFQRGLWIEPGPMNYPVLLAYLNNAGCLEIGPERAELDEIGLQVLIGLGGINITATTVDFNEDGDLFDSFPTSVRGIVWTNAAYVQLKDAAWAFQGSVINRHIIVENNVSIDNDPALRNVLAPGFIGSGMRLVSGSYREVMQ